MDVDSHTYPSVMEEALPPNGYGPGQPQYSMNGTNNTHRTYPATMLPVVYHDYPYQAATMTSLGQPVLPPCAEVAPSFPADYNFTTPSASSVPQYANLDQSIAVHPTLPSMTEIASSITDVKPLAVNGTMETLTSPNGACGYVGNGDWFNHDAHSNPESSVAGSGEDLNSDSIFYDTSSTAPTDLSILDISLNSFSEINSPTYPRSPRMNFTDVNPVSTGPFVFASAEQCTSSSDKTVMPKKKARTRANPSVPRQRRTKKSNDVVANSDVSPAGVCLSSVNDEMLQIEMKNLQEDIELFLRSVACNPENAAVKTLILSRLDHPEQYNNPSPLDVYQMFAFTQ